jgi:transcriptional regulator GlxA family with amidase domain
VLAAALPAPAGASDPVQRAIDAMVRAGGALEVEPLARHANLSPRQFRRRCLEEAGLAPKQLSRVLRFRRALGLLQSGAPAGAQLAAECGYYDQAHFIHDFREFSGQTPGAYASVFSNPAAEQSDSITP